MFKKTKKVNVKGNGFQNLITGVSINTVLLIMYYVLAS